MNIPVEINQDDIISSLIREGNDVELISFIRRIDRDVDRLGFTKNLILELFKGFCSDAFEEQIKEFKKEINEI